MKIYLESEALPFWLGIIKARINEGINRVTLIELELASRDELKPEDMDGLIGKPITLLVEDVINNSLHKSRFDGLIFEMIDVTGGKTVQGIYYYTMVIRPRLWVLNYFVHSRSFTDTTRIEVIDDLLKEHGLASGEHYTASYRSEKVYPPFHQILQTGDSDLAFFEETASNAGINYYFAADEEAQKPEQLHLVDDNAFFAPYDETIPIVDAAGMVQNERRVEHITRLTRAVPGKVTGTAFLGQGSTLSKTSNQAVEGASTDGEIHVYVPEGGQDRSGVAKQAAKVKAEGFAAQRVVHRGVSDHIRIRPGKRVTLRSFATAREYGILVTEVRHTFEQNVLAALDEDASNEPIYNNYFTAAEPRSPVRPAHVTNEVDIDFALDAALDLDLNGKVTINPKFEMNNEFNFNPSFKPEINAKGIGVLLAGLAGLQAQVLALKKQVAALKGGAGGADAAGVTSGMVVDPAVFDKGELCCKVQLDGSKNTITAKVIALWHTERGGMHCLPRAGMHVWLQRIGGAKGNDWLVVGYRPSSQVPLANDPANSTTIKGLKNESEPAWGGPSGNIVSVEDPSFKNDRRVGIMGEGNIAEMYIADGEGNAVTRANKNIYQQCDEQHHLRCKDELTEVSGTTWQQYGNLHRLVTGEHKENIGGGRTLTVVGEENKNVKQKQTLKVDLAQDVTIGQGQTTNILSGNRELTVAGGDSKVLINGSETRTVAKDCILTTNGATKVVNLGNVNNLKSGSDEWLSIDEKIGVCIARKAEAEMSACEKLNIGGALEQNISCKHSITYGVVKEVNNAIKLSKTLAAEKIEAEVMIDIIAGVMLSNKCKLYDLESNLVTTRTKMLMIK